MAATKDYFYNQIICKIFSYLIHLVYKMSQTHYKYSLKGPEDKDYVFFLNILFNFTSDKEKKKRSGWGWSLYYIDISFSSRSFFILWYKQCDYSNLQWGNKSGVSARPPCNHNIPRLSSRWFLPSTWGIQANICLFGLCGIIWMEHLDGRDVFRKQAGVV